MKAKQKQAKKQPAARKPRKKLQFEDVVKAALVSAAVVCAVVLGIGGFYIVRSVLSGGYTALSDGTPEPTPIAEAETAAPDDLSAAVPGLEQAILDLETANAIASASDTDAQPALPPGGPNTANAAPAVSKGILVLVIDDAGNNLRDLEPFLQFPGPLTIAVLPGLANSVEAARRVRAAGKELFLHQPMEPLNGQDPGPRAIKTGMSPAEVKEILVKNLNEIGPVTGINNHEGSRATADPAIMRPLLEISRDGALYFLDSRTTADTASPQIARELGINIAQRNFFLDNEQDRESIRAVLEAGCIWAEQNGTAILIGHAWSPRLAAILAETHPQIIERGLIFASIGTLLGRGK